MSYKIFFYLALLFIPFDSFPFNIYGLGSSKPLSIYFFMIFFILNAKNIFKIKFSREDILFFIFIPIICLLSFFKAKYSFNDIKGVATFLNSIFGFVSIYISFCIVITNTKSKNQIDKYIRIIVIGYFIAIIIGILEIMFMYLNMAFLADILKCVLRDTNYLTEKRVHFSFGEPSYIGQHLFLVLVPILYYKIYYQKKYQLKRYSIMFILFIIIAILSFSSQLVIDSIVFFILNFLINKTFKKKLIYILLLVVGIFTINNFFIDNNYFNIQSPYYTRIVNNIESIKGSNLKDVIDNDQSIRVRYDLSAISERASKDYILTGYGMGNFIFEYKRYINEIDPYFFNNKELTNIYNSNYKYAYNFYLSILSEGGIIGIIWMLLFFKGIFKNKDIFHIFMLVALYLLLQNNIFGSIPIIFWFCYSKRNNFNDNKGCIGGKQ
jgi:hypothetical protein